MSATKFPYSGWVLMPSFKPVELTFVDVYYGDWDRSQSGKAYRTSDIHATKATAIAAGYDGLNKQQLAIEKLQNKAKKRRAALVKAEEGGAK